MIRFVILVVVTLIYFYCAKLSFEYLANVYLSKQEEFLLMLISVIGASDLSRD